MPYIVYDEPEKKRPDFIIIILLLCLAVSVWWFFIHKETSESTPVIPVELSDEELQGSCYHYEQLSDDEKTVYKSMYQACLNFEPDVSILPVEMEKCERAVYAFRNDHPEFYWTNEAISTSQFSTGMTEKISFVVPIDAKTKTEHLSKKADEILSSAPEDEYEKVKYIYEYIILNTDYNINAKDNQTAYSALIGKSSVCGGYANAFLYLCDRAGVYCGYITGEIKGKEKHAWNFIRIDGQYYWVDTTWGDPAYTNPIKGYEKVFYDYLCATDAAILPERILASDPAYSDYKNYMDFTYPNCFDNSLNYYVRSGSYLEYYSRPAIYNTIIMQATNPYTDTITIKLANEEAFKEALEDLFESGAYWQKITGDLKSYYNIDISDNEVMTLGGRLHHIAILK